MSIADRIRERLREIDELALRRTLRSPSGVDLSSNDYLGMAAHPRLIARVAAAATELGVGSTGSRLLRGEREVFRAVEARFAEFKTTERALYFSTGYAANLAILSTIPEDGDIVYSDALNHASLIDGMRLGRARRVIYPHNDAAALRELMQRDGNAQKFVVTESLFSMDGDFAPLRELAAVCREFDAALIVDEAHAVGVYGSGGSGLIEAAGIAGNVFLSINTAGKALGVAGAFVCGSSDAIELLVQRARPFIFSTAPLPLSAPAIDEALDVVRDEPHRREELLRKSVLLRARLAEIGCNVLSGSSQIIPVIIGENADAMRVAAALQEQGFDVRAVRPPTVPKGTARLRVSLNVNVSDEELERFVAVMSHRVPHASSRAFL